VWDEANRALDAFEKAMRDAGVFVFAWAPLGGDGQSGCLYDRTVGWSGDIGDNGVDPTSWRLQVPGFIGYRDRCEWDRDTTLHAVATLPALLAKIRCTLEKTDALASTAEPVLNIFRNQEAQ